VRGVAKRTADPLVGLREGDDGSLRFKLTAPGGGFVWVSEHHEVKMSHWIARGALYRLDDARTPVFEPAPEWSFERVAWEGPLVLSLLARRYPGTDAPVTARLDLEAGTARLSPFDLAAAHAAGAYTWLSERDLPRFPDRDLTLAELGRWFSDSG